MNPFIADLVNYLEYNTFKVLKPQQLKFELPKNQDQNWHLTILLDNCEYNCQSIHRLYSTPLLSSASVSSSGRITCIFQIPPKYTKTYFEKEKQLAALSNNIFMWELK